MSNLILRPPVRAIPTVLWICGQQVCVSKDKEPWVELVWMWSDAYAEYKFQSHRPKWAASSPTNMQRRLLDFKVQATMAVLINL